MGRGCSNTDRFANSASARALLIAAALASMGCGARADEPGGPGDHAAPPRPVPRFVNREREDWRVLRERDDGAPLDALKDIRLDGDGTVSLSLGVSARLRYEHFENFAFRPEHDAGSLLSQARLHADLQIGERLRFFVEGNTSWITQRDLPGGVRPIDEDQADLTQAWASVGIPLGDEVGAELRVGRQQLNFGAQRLVSPLPWANVFRAWDGALLDLAVGDWTVTPFWAALVPVRRFRFNDPDDDRQLWGVYATGPLGESLNADVYVLGTDDDRSTSVNGTTGDQRRRTLGARLSRPRTPGVFDLDLEGALQIGRIGGRDILAGFVDGEAGRTFAGDWAPRLAIGGGYASGDNAAGGDVQTFDPLFPLGHAYLGYADQIGRSNVIEARAVGEVRPHDRVRVRASAHTFWRASTDDAVYNAGGGVIRAAGASGRRHLGFELDLVATWTISANATLEAGYSYFRASDFFEIDGIRSDLSFAYSQLILKF